MKGYDLRIVAVFSLLFIVTFFLSGCSSKYEQSDGKIYPTTVSAEIKKIFKDNYKNFDTVGEYMLNNKGDDTIFINSDNQLIAKNGKGETISLEDKVKAEVETLLYKLGISSIKENSNEIDFIKELNGRQEIIIRCKPGYHQGSEFIADGVLAEEWHFRNH